MFTLGGWNFVVISAEVDERILPGEDARAYVSRLAQSKAQAGALLAPAESLVVAADTTVVDRGRILGKPANPAQARAMLIQLRGRKHQVYTAIALARPQDGVLLTDCCLTQVRMRRYSDDEVEEYIATGDPLDKAGAYAIQHPGFNPVESLDGCYANVVGLPLCHLQRALFRLGVKPQADIPAACQATLRHVCPIFRQVLEGEY